MNKKELKLKIRSNIRNFNKKDIEHKVGNYHVNKLPMKVNAVPTAWEDALSPLEWIGKLNLKINEIIEICNFLQEQIENIPEIIKPYILQFLSEVLPEILSELLEPIYILLDTKQNITDENLDTTDKSIVGAINEVLATGGKVQSVNGKEGNVVLKAEDIKNNANETVEDVLNELLSRSVLKILQSDTKPASPEANTLYFVGTASPYHLYLYDDNLVETDLGDFSIDLTPYQTKNDASLITTAKTIVGAINELKNIVGSGEIIPDSVSSRNVIENLTDGLNDLYEKITFYQKIYDEELETDEKTVVGAINENKANIELKQNKTDNTLATVNKTIVGAINEVLATGGKVQKVNGKEGNVVLKAEDIKNNANETVEDVLNILLSRRVVSILHSSTIPTTPQANTLYFVGTASPYHLYLYDTNLQQLDLGEFDIDLEPYQLKTDNLFQTTAKTVVGAVNELKGSIEEKQNVEDSDLETTDKTIVGAINENYEHLDDNDTQIANILLEIGTDIISGIGTSIKNAIVNLKTMIDNIESKITIKNNSYEPTGNITFNNVFLTTGDVEKQIIVSLTQGIKIKNNENIKYLNFGVAVKGTDNTELYIQGPGQTIYDTDLIVNGVIQNPYITSIINQNGILIINTTNKIMAQIGASSPFEMPTNMFANMINKVTIGF